MEKNEKWVLNHISNNPNISFGSLFRDSCFYIKNQHSWFFLTIKKLVAEGIITETRNDDNSYYNLGKELKRDKILNTLLNEEKI